MPEKSHIFLIGIGGIGMSALARYFMGHGRKVAGYDRVRNPVCEDLERNGISIIYDDQPELIPPSFCDSTNTEVIYTPAVPNDQKILSFYRGEGFKLEKRAERLGQLSRQHRCLAVAGTHGKTTTSCLLAHLFREAGMNPTAFLGGIAVNYQSNYLAGEPGGIMIAEADEYDRSFLQLQAEGAIITSTDSDHLDIYENKDNLQHAFKAFAKSVKGPKLVHRDTGLEGLTYAVEEPADFMASNVRIEEHRFVFDIVSNDFTIENISSVLPGRHNVENSIAAAALAFKFGLKEAAIRTGIQSFRGVKRRFEYHITREDLIFIDDYAHHPT